MKKVFLSFFLSFFLIFVITGCVKEPIVNDSADLQEFSFVKDGIKFTITPVETPRTKNSNVNRSVICAEKDSLSLTFVNEYEVVEDDLMIVQNFTENEILLATYIMRNNEVLDVELPPFLEDDFEYDYNDNNSKEFNPYRKDGEKYGECVKRVYRESKEIAKSDFINEVVCDIVPQFCVGLHLYTAIVGCTLNEREYELLMKEW
jgi:hypothetical protein